jgi:hypothetical protein
MRFDPRLEEGRVLHGRQASRRHDRYGAFSVHGPCGEMLTIIACDGGVPYPELAGWEHVSVSTRRRIPNWREMCFVKDLFWAPEECVVQYHPPRSEYVNNHEYTLHLWKWTKGEFPLPPSILVGVKEHGVMTPAEAELLSREFERATRRG